MDSNVHITVFESLTNPIGRRLNMPLTTFAEVLERKRELDNKKDTKLFSGTTFTENKPRGVKTALSAHLLVLDFDNAQATGRNDKLVSINDVKGALEQSGIRGFIATSYSHRDAIPRFRAVIPFKEPVPATEWGSFAPAALDHLGLKRLQFGLDMKALRDVAHIYFFPSCPKGGKQQFVEVEGELFDPRDVARSHTNAREGPHLLAGQSDPADLDLMEAFSRYKGDLRTLDIVALLTSKGFEVITNASGFNYFQCPWEDEHSHPGGVSAWVKRGTNRLPRFSCWHDACAERSLINLLEEFDAEDVDAHCKSTFDPLAPYDPSEVGKAEIVLDFNLERSVDQCIQVLAESGVVFRRGDVLVDLPGYMEFLRSTR